MSDSLLETASTTDNPHATIENNFKCRLIVNMWCRMLHDQLLFIGPFIFESRLNGQMYLQVLEELLKLLEDVPLARRLRMYLLHNRVHPHFS